jgi:hypothetical protein
MAAVVAAAHGATVTAQGATLTVLEVKKAALEVSSVANGVILMEIRDLQRARSGLCSIQ